MTIIAPSPQRPKRLKPKQPTREQPEQPERVVLRGVSWDTYSSLLTELEEQHFRLTYDDGTLEISLPLLIHEKWKKLIGGMIELIPLEMDIPMGRFGSTTFRKKNLKKGAEPDECYYVQNEPKMRGKTKLDLRRDPPPDLVVEIDITSSTVPKQPIYAALGVAEAWRFDGMRLQSLRRTARGEYVQHEYSLAFPFLKMADVERFLRRWPKTDETNVLRAWRDWLRTKGRG